MVFNHGKPYWLKMDFVILSVVGKDPARRNKWHPLLVGKRCGVEHLELRRTGHLWIEGLVEWEEYSPFYTSPVLNLDFQNDVLTVETENSVYKLEMQYAEESND